MRNSDEYPEAHRSYIVRRDGKYFTAIPCYGMHKPWWVVKIMSDNVRNDNMEAEPVNMRETDEWFERDVFEQIRLLLKTLSAPPTK